MKKILTICFIVVLLVLIAYCITNIIKDNNSKVITFDDCFKETIDSLNNVCDSLNTVRLQLLDSINKSDTKIVVITKQYEKDFNTIITQSVDSDCLFFSNYIELSKDIE